MKTNICYRSRIILLSVMIFSLIFVVRPARAQNDTAAVSQSRVSMKIVQKTNGDSTVTDTTITFDGPYSAEDIRELTKNMKEQARVIREQMKNYREQMGTLKEFQDQMGALKEFDFDIDIPEIPDFPDVFMIPGIPDIPPVIFNGDSIKVSRKPGPPMRVFRHHSSGHGDLNAVLGDIPMDRVKSLSIKERKNGRKIVIEIDDTPSRRIKKEIIMVRPDEKHRKARTYKIKPGSSGMMTI